MSVTLPIQHSKASFIEALTKHSMIVLSAPPGAGKSTELPLWFLQNDLLNGHIYLLQPRRLAAKNIACYLAQQLGENVGKTVGYRLRNDSNVSKNTKLTVITEGILTQIIQQDPELADVACILFDEFHERSNHADFAFALAREVQTSLREDLRIVLMSATLSSGELTAKLPDAVMIESEGRSFPVELSYYPPSSQKHWRDHALSVIKHALTAHQGSILVFLTGSSDIRFLAEKLADFLPNNFILAPLFGDLTLDEQQRAILPAKQGHKLVLATNIAETSITIEGINLVIDCGFEKVAIFDNQTLTNRIQTQSISKASAIQRMGRAGRVMAGKCIRLYNEEEFQRRRAQPISEILQTDLLPVLIETARWGVGKLSDLPLLEFPKNIDEKQAWETLMGLNIVDEKHQLTIQGKQVAELPCHPRFAHMIVRACEIEITHAIPQIISLACLLAALLEERDIFSIDYAKNNCDITLRVNELLHTKRGGLSQRILQQAKQLIQKAKTLLLNNVVNKGTNTSIETVLSTELPTEYCGVLLAIAYPERIAKLRDSTQHGKFIAANGQGLEISSTDALAGADFIVAAHLGQFNKQLTVRLAASVNLSQLTNIAGVKLITRHVCRYDESAGRIVANEQQCLASIVITEKPYQDSLNEDEITDMWHALLLKKGLAWLPMPDKTYDLLARWRWVNTYQTHLDFPLADEESLLACASQWFSPFVGNITKKTQFAKLNYSDMLLSLLNYQQQCLFKQLTPSVFIGPTGRQCPITYNQDAQPKVSLPMQELYGQATSPQVGDVEQGKGVSLLLELLSPAGRPIQITQDLTLFWQGSYKDVQKDMKGRYPKHFWPDDPANEKPTNKTKAKR